MQNKLKQFRDIICGILSVIIILLLILLFSGVLIGENALLILPVAIVTLIIFLLDIIIYIVLSIKIK